MSIRFRCLLGLSAVLLGGIARPGAAQSTAPVYNPANGHWYQYVSPPGQIDWPNARAAAASVSYAGYPGHLATITSPDENQFVSRYLTTNGVQGGIWLGGYQDHSAPDYSEPAGGWRWLTGEPWGYTSWFQGEPNNAGNEDALEMASVGNWNDLSPLQRQGSYLIEYEPTPTNTGPLLSFSPNPIVGGQPATGQLILAQAAGLGGTVVTLTSSNPAAAVPPAIVVVPPGANSLSFPVVTFAVAAATPATITATYSGGVGSAALQVLPGSSSAPSPSLPPGHQAAGPPVYNPANGHYYQAILTSDGLNFYQAEGFAAGLLYLGLSGHLVTITSEAEQQFVASRLPVGQQQYWWIGAYQDRTAPDYREPGGGWRWVTGEPFGPYTHWYPGQPDNDGNVWSNGENALEFDAKLGNWWNDYPEAIPIHGYLVEYESPVAATPAPTPAPATSAQLVLFPNPALGGQPALGQVVLSQPAAAGGVVVALTSSNPAAAAVPSGVTVPAGSVTATFLITTFPVAAPTPVSIMAGCSFGSATAILQLLPIAGSPSPGGANLLVNGGFELPVVPAGRANQTLTGPGDLPGWRIVRGSVDVVPSLPSDWQPAPDGGRQSLDLVGTPGAATIEQTFPTQPGQVYVFSGWLSHNYGIPEGRANVFLNGAFFVQLYHAVPNSREDMKWTFFSYPFRATAATTTLTLADVTNLSDVRGTALDGLSVSLAPDTNPPPVNPPAGLAAPLNLTATMATEARVRLAWTDASGTETGFAIWRRTNSSDWTRVGAVPANVTSFTDAGVCPSTLYTYRVQATSEGAVSPWSNEASLTTPAAPAAPVGLTATVAGPNAIALAWSVNPSNSTAVELYRKGGGADWRLIAVLAPGSTGYQDRGVAPGASYTYRVRAANDYFASGWSNEAGITTPAGGV